MKKNVSVILSLILLIFFAGCRFNYSEGGKKIDIEKDGNELLLAKASLKYIEENFPDSLKQIFNEKVIQRIASKQFEWLFINGKRVIHNNKYPSDSIITVSYITSKSILRERTFKEFNFPFINENNPDSTMYFKITVEENKIYKLMLSTGMRFIK